MENTFTEFVNFCEKYLIKTPDLVKLMRKRYSECNNSYKQSHEFLDCVEITRAKIESDDARIFVHLRDFLKDLKKHKVSDHDSHKKKRKKHPSDFASDSYDSSEPSPKSAKTDSTDTSDTENATTCALKLYNLPAVEVQDKGAGVAVNQENGGEIIIEDDEVKVHSKDQSKSKDNGHLTPLVSPSKHFEVLEVSANTIDSDGDCTILDDIDTHKHVEKEKTESSEKTDNQRFKFTKHKVDKLVKDFGLKKIIERKNSTSSNSSLDRGCLSVSSESEDDAITCRSSDSPTDHKSQEKLSSAEETSLSSASPSTSSSEHKVITSEPQEKRLKLDQNTKNGSIAKEQKVVNVDDSLTEKSHDLSCDLFDSSVDDVAKVDAEEVTSAADISSGDSVGNSVLKKPDHCKDADSSLVTDNAEPSTSIAEDPSTYSAEELSASIAEELLTSTVEEPSTSIAEKLSSSTANELLTSAVKEQPISTAEKPSTSTSEKPSASTAEKLSTSTAEEQSTSTAEEPSTSTAEKPSTSTAEKPSTSTAEKPSISAVKELSTLIAEEPSASTAEKPSTSAVKELSTLTAEEPSASTAEKPSTSTAEKPSRSAVKELSTLTAEEPSTSTSEKPSTSTAEKPSTSTAEEHSTSTAEEPSTSAVKELSTSTSEKPSTSTADEEAPIQKKGSKRQIQRLEKLLEEIRNKIEELKTVELSLDDMEAEDSNYILEDKYQKKFVKVWSKLCELKGSLTTTGRPVEKRFSYTGTRYPEINRKIEKFVNRKKVFPDYHDVWEIINKVNKTTKMGLRGPAVDRLAREAFTDVGDILQKRRQRDLVYTSQGFVPEAFRKEDDPALKDLELKKKLEENRKLSKDRLEEVVEKFCKKQENYKQEDDGENEESGEDNSAQNSDSDEENIEVPEMDKIIAETDNCQPQTNSKLQYDSSTLHASSTHRTGSSKSVENLSEINLIKSDDDDIQFESWSKTSSPSKEILSNKLHTSNGSKDEILISAAGEITVDNSSDEEILISEDIVIDIAENSLNDEESDLKGENITGIDEKEEDRFDDNKEIGDGKSQQKDDEQENLEDDKMSTSKHTPEHLDKENEQVEISSISECDEEIELKTDESSDLDDDVLLNDDDKTKDSPVKKENGDFNNKNCTDSDVDGNPVRKSNSKPNRPVSGSDPTDDLSGLDSSCVVIEDEDSCRSDQEQGPGIKIENVRSVMVMDDIDRMFDDSDNSECDSKLKLPEACYSSSDNEAVKSDAEKFSSSSSDQQTVCKQNHSPGVSTSVSSSHSSPPNVYFKKTPLSSWCASKSKSSGNKVRVYDSSANNSNRTANATSNSADDNTVIAIDDSDDDIDDTTDNENVRLSDDGTGGMYSIVENKSPGSASSTKDLDDSSGGDSDDCVILLDSD